ncbi:MAG: hypothetical protein ACOZCO_08400 [Bacteroidota bacterium]
MKHLLLFLLFSPVLLVAQEDSVLNPLQQEVYNVVNKVESEERFFDGFSSDSAQHLPFGIIKEMGSTRYIIAVDSAEFRSSGAWFNAYMAVDFPGTTKKIAFAAKHIKFNPKGVTGGNQSRLMLVSDHSIKISSNITLQLKADGRNFVEWDCNGFRSVNLKGYFEFSETILIPESENNGEKVTASFEINTPDIHQFVAQVSITPFRLNKLKDWSFRVTDAVVDMSEITNAQGMIFPTGYDFSSMNFPQMWTGFYLKKLVIKLPGEFSRNGIPAEVQAEKLLMDNSGLSGNFTASNVFPASEGDMSGWGFSVQQLGVNFLSGKLNGGNIKGEIIIPAVENNGLGYTAAVVYNPVNEETDYCFSVNPKNNVQLNVFSAKMDLYNTSRVNVTKLNGKFLPSAILNGKITFSHEQASTPALSFQNLTFTTQAPYLTAGVFAYGNPNDSLSSQNRVGKFPVSLYNMFVIVHPEKPKINMGVRLNFMNSENFGFAAQTNIMFGAKVNQDSNGETWSFDKLSIHDISLLVNTQPFYLNGTIIFENDHPVYGDGFAGQIEFRFKELMDESFQVKTRFGHTTYKYFYVDAWVPVKIKIPSTPFELTRMAGGLYYHMRPMNNTVNDCISHMSIPPQNNQPFQEYYPDPSISLGFRVGSGFQFSPNEKTMNGEMMLDVSFLSSGGLNAIRLNGNAFFLSTFNDRLTKPAPVYATASIVFDNVNKVFDATFNANVNVPHAVNGFASSKIYVSPDLWYVCVGRPTQPAYINLLGIASATAYVMAGQQLEPMPPPFPVVANLVAQTGLDQQRNNEALANASGFAAGIRFQSSFYKEFGFDFFSVYGGFAFGVGFDMMLANFGSQAHCAGSSETAGMNGWVAQGQLFAYLQGTIGIKGTVFKQDFDLVVLSATVAAIVGGKIPNPSYVYGALACQYTILSCINGSFNFDFSVGNDCTIVN